MKRVLYNGKNLKEYCKERGVLVHRVEQARFKQGISDIEEAIEYAKCPQHAMYNYCGMTLHKYCISAGKSYHKVWNRIKKGMTIKEALNYDQV